MNVTDMAKKARESSLKLANLDTNTKNKVLEAMAVAIEENTQQILEANKKDLDEAKVLVEKGEMSNALYKRLVADESKIKQMAESIRSVAKLEDPVGKKISGLELDKDLELYQITCPIGVICTIFESRPDVVPQITSLCLKSGNAVLLKGGSEAINTNKVMVELLANSGTDAGAPEDFVQLLETREDIQKILDLDEYVSLIIPRGSNALVKHIQNNTRIPVLGHADGICHVFVDKEADIDLAVNISVDSKTQYPAVCNAMETLLVDESVAEEFLPGAIKQLLEKEVEIRGDETTTKIAESNNLKINKAEEKDWSTEYNDLILSIKVVKDLDEAISHINKFGSGHTDSIVTKNQDTAKKFLDEVDSACVFHNCSTRFSDGFRFGKGAEVGISTNKIHARGPVGLEGLVIYKYKLYGKGQIVAEYGSEGKKFTHKKID
ncbi:glutamate-5-semialdehyde dehydrogenase [Nanoarchaeota archaeon]